MASAGAAPSPGSVVATTAAAAHLWLVPGGVGLQDAGELGAAAATLGVPHPTGFALDLLVLKLGVFLPLGSIAFRQNLVVALISALCLGLLAELIGRVASELGCDPGDAFAGAVFGAAGLGCWTTFLGTGLVVEVYSTSLLFVLAACLAISGRSSSMLLFLGLLAGLSFSVHVTSRVYLLPLFAVALYRSRERRQASLLSLGLAVVGLLILVYLPLASLRDPPLDWGDPETPSRLWEYVSAERIRSAYSDAMLAPEARAMAAFSGHLAELWPLLLPAGLAIAFSYRRARGWLLTMLVFAALDLAYVALLHPMGVTGRQVGHVTGAVLACLAGVGAAVALRWAGEGRGRRLAVQLSLSLSVVSLVLGAPRDLAAGGEVADELIGAGGQVGWLASRAIVVCATDDACAVTFFALHAEGARPDVSVVPAQHLWEPTMRALVARDVPGFDELRERRPPAGAERALLVERAVGLLAGERVRRPVRWEGEGPAEPLGRPLVPSGEGSWLELWRREVEVEGGARLRLEAAYAARLGEGPAHDGAGRAAWSRAFDRLGRGSLAAGEPREAILCFERAIAAAPERATGHSNLGVARASVGDWRGAIDAVGRAVELDPTSRAAWANLATYLARTGDIEGAREAIRRAEDAGVSDRRLDELAEILGS